jgi:hypothetical protein
VAAEVEAVAAVAVDVADMAVAAVTVVAVVVDMAAVEAAVDHMEAAAAEDMVAAAEDMAAAAAAAMDPVIKLFFESFCYNDIVCNRFSSCKDLAHVHCVDFFISPLLLAPSLSFFFCSNIK